MTHKAKYFKQKSIVNVKQYLHYMGIQKLTIDLPIIIAHIRYCDFICVFRRWRFR